MYSVGAPAFLILLISLSENLNSPDFPAPPIPPGLEEFSSPPLPPIPPDIVKVTSVASVGIPTLLLTPEETDSISVVNCVLLTTCSTVLLVDKTTS